MLIQEICLFNSSFELDGCQISERCTVTDHGTVCVLHGLISWNSWTKADLHGHKLGFRPLTLSYILYKLNFLYNASLKLHHVLWVFLARYFSVYPTSLLLFLYYMLHYLIDIIFFFFCIFYFSSSKCLQFPLTTLFEETNELSDANSKRRRRYMMMMNLRPGFFA